MGQNDGEDSKNKYISIASAVAQFPIGYLPPKQLLIPFSAPFDMTIDSKTDPTSVSAKPTKEMVESILEDLKVPSTDLEFVKFKKPASKLPHSDEVPDSSLGEFDRSVLSLIKPLSKKSYIKPELKVRRIRLKEDIDPEEVAQLREEVVSSSSTKRKLSQDETNTKRLKTMDRKIISVGLNTDKVALDAKNQINDSIHDDSKSLKWWKQMKSNFIKLERSGLVETVGVDDLLELESQINATLLQTGASEFKFIEYLKQPDSFKSFHSSINLGLSSIEAVEILTMILSCHLKDKRLFKETLFIQALEFLQDLQNAVLPLFTYSTENVTVDDENMIETLLENLIILMNALTEFLRVKPVSDSVVTHMEYFAFGFIFAQTLDSSSKKWCSSLEKLRYCSSRTLFVIARSYPDQSQFIVNELFANLDRFAALKIQGKRYTLSRGISVQYISMLLVGLVQEVDCKDYKFDDSYWTMTGSGSSSRQTQRKVVKEMEGKFFEYLEAKVRRSVEVSKEIAASISTRISAPSTNVQIKKTLEDLVGDFIAMLDFPEYAGCEQILESVMAVMLYICSTDFRKMEEEENEKKDQNKDAEPSLYLGFDIAGMIGSKLLLLYRGRRSFGRDEFEEEYFEETSSKQIQLLEYLHDNDTDVNNGFWFTFTSYLSELHRYEERVESKIADLDTKSSELQNNTMIEKYKKLRRNVRKLQRLLNQILNGNSEALSKYSSDRAEAITNYHDLLCGRKLVEQYKPFLALITRSLGSEKVKTRSLAIKSLSLLIDQDISIAKIPAIKNILALQLEKSYASVCSPIIDIAYRVIQSDSTMIRDFYRMISRRIDDPSNSIRRKAITVCTYMYKETEDVTIRACISEKLLQRIDDEDDNIMYQASESLIDVWFMSIENVYHKSLVNSGISLKTEIMSTVDVIIHIFEQGGDKNWEYFERFIREKVLLPSELNDGIEDSLHHSLVLLVECLLEYNTEDAAMIDDDRERNAKVSSFMKFISIIINCDRSLISQDQLLALQPYFTEDISSSSLCYYTLQIFKLSLPQMTNLNPRFINECQTSLMRRLTQFNSKELEEAIVCIWELAKRSRTTLSIANACISSLRLLIPLMNQFNHSRLVKSDRLNRTKRLLYLIGCFGRECQLEKFHSLFIKSNVGINEKESVVSLIVRYLMFFTKFKSMQRPAVKNIVGICATHPSLFMSKKIQAVIKDAYSGIDTVLKGMVTEQLASFLREEDRRTSERNGLGVKHSGKGELDIAVFHGKSSRYLNDSICTLIVRQYLQPILSCSLTPNRQCTREAVNFIRLVLKLGLTNPAIPFATVIALEASPFPEIRTSARQIHEDICDRYEELVEHCYQQGFELAVEYRRKLVKFDELISMKTLVVGMVNIVKKRTNKLKYLKFFSMIAGSLKVKNPAGLLENKTTSRCWELKDYICFMAFNIIELPLETGEEAMTVIDAIGRIKNSSVGSFLTLLEIYDDGGRDKSLWIKIGLVARALIMICKLEEAILETYGLTGKVLSQLHDGGIKKLKAKLKRQEGIELEIEDEDMEGKDTSYKKSQELCEILTDIYHH